MAGYQVQQDVHAAPVNFFKELAGIVVYPVTRGDFVIITHVITRILEGRVIARVEPDRIDAQVLEIFQFLQDAWQVANPIAV